MTAETIRDGLFAVIRHSTEPMVLSDPHQADAPLVAVNQAFQDLTGYAAAEILGRNCRFLQGADTDRVTVDRIRSSLLAEEGCIQWIANYRRDGTKFWNLLFISPIFGDAGELLYFFANQHDLTTGLPPGLPELQLGPAHMSPEQQAELHALLNEIVLDDQDAADAPSAAARAVALEAALAGARDVAKLSIKLSPGHR